MLSKNNKLFDFKPSEESTNKLSIEDKIMLSKNNKVFDFKPSEENKDKLSIRV